MKFVYAFLFSSLLIACGETDKPASTKTNTVNNENTFKKEQSSEAVDKPSRIVEKPLIAEKEKAFSGDTIFILRTLNEGVYHAIYIEKRKNTQRFRWLTNFGFDTYDSDGYSSNKAYQKNKYPDAYKTKQNLFGLSKNWVPLHKYKNDFYTYSPSDWGNIGQRMLSEYEFIQMYMDGPSYNPIRSTKKINNREMVFSFYSGESLTVYLYDAIHKIYIFKLSENSGYTDYGFYTPKTNAQNFDMIVNYCKNQKQREYQFENVDFEALIQKIK